ncbi:Cancer-related nucleoside-triphosphatase like [Schistosoma japonicum]|nr:Cancer-related nucleoside-triphosphatase like [Schistosoma japonicum]
MKHFISIYLSILLIYTSGIGKTTLVSRVFEELCKHGIHTVGFKTEEIRQSYSGRSSRLGFDIVLFDSSLKYPRASLARLVNQSNQHQPRVGQYFVDISSFESLAIPCLQSIVNSLGNVSSNGNLLKNNLIVCIIDEIGKMELCSCKFTCLIDKLVTLITNLSPCNTSNIKHPTVILLATVPSPKRSDGTRGIPFVDRICSMKQAWITEIDISNRDATVQEIIQRILNYKSL